MEPSGVAGSKKASLASKLKCISAKTLVVLLTVGMTFSTTPTQLWAEGVEGIVEAAQDAGAGIAEQATASAEASSQNEDQAQAASVSDGSSAASSTSQDGAAAASGDDVESEDSVQSETSQAADASQGDTTFDDEAGSGTALSNESDAEAVAASATPFYLHHVTVSSEQVTGSTAVQAKSVKVGETLWAATFVGGAPGYSARVATDDDGITYQWQYSATKSKTDSDFKDISGATSLSYRVPTTIDGVSAAGLYLRVKATDTYGTVGVSTKPRGVTPPFIEAYGSVDPVAVEASAVSTETAADVVAQLAGYTPKFTYGTDTNANAVLEKKITSLGKTGATVKVKSAQATSEVADAQFGVSSADDGTNGTITYFSADIANASAEVDLSACGSVDLVYEISYNGTTAEFSASAVKIPLDTTKMKEYLQSVSEGFGPVYAAGDTADAITQDLTLPAYADSHKGIKVTWTSSSDAVLKPASSEDGKSTVSRGKKDTKVTLKAKLSFTQLGSGARYPTVTKTYEVTVKADPEKAKEVSAVVSVVGIDGEDANVTWAAPDSYTIDGGGTIADYTTKAFEELGLTYTVSGTGENWYLSTISDPNDANRTLGFDQTTWKYWQLFVNGEAAEQGAGKINVSEGDKIVWYYSGYGDSAPAEQVAVKAYIMGQDATGAAQMWAAPRNVYVEKGATGADVTIALCKAAGIGLTYSDSQYGFYLTSMTSPYDSSVTLDNSKWNTTGESWQLHFGKAGSLPAYSTVGASSIKVEDGDQIVWYYGTRTASMPSEKTATAQVIGQDASGRAQYWGSAQPISFISGETAADVSAGVFKSIGIKAATTGAGASWNISSLTSPYDKSVVLKSAAAGATWKLFVNGELVTGSAGVYKIAENDRIVWCYTAGDSLPDPSALIINPNAARSDETAEWSGFVNGGSTTLVNVPTPTESASELWKVNLKTDSDPWVPLGDPIIVGGYVYVTTNSQLIKIDSKGNVVARVSKGGTTSYFSRPVYADGLIISANDNGSIYAFSAQTLECVWSTPALDVPATGRYQANNTMTVANGCVYAEFVSGASYSGAAKAGAMVCVDLATGKVKWTKTTVKSDESTGEGYYWAGAAASGSDLVIGDEGGRVQLIDGATGEVKSSVSIGANPIRATVVSAGTENGKQIYLAVGRQPATLYKIAREGDALSVVDACEFGNTSTSTPAVAGGKAYIGGNDADYNGQFTVIDLASMEVESTYSTGKYAEVKASPLVSVQGDDTYVYFTYNCNPGGVLRYSQNTGEVVEIYTPSGSEAQYCTASVIADAAGNLYYTNDSGTLFALKAAAGYKVTFDTQGGSTVPAANPAQGKPMVAPSDPVREGYTFLGWFSDAEGTTKWNFADPVTSNMTLYAKWKKDATPVPDDGKKDDDPKKDNPKKDDGKNDDSSDDKKNTDDTNSNVDDSSSAAKNASPTAAGVNIALKSNASASLASALNGNTPARTALLSGFGSTDASAEEEEAPMLVSARAAVETDCSLPIWPFVGIGIGAVVLALVAIKRLKEAK